MHPLVIKLHGTIEETNFDEWKNELISQIQSVNTSLTTDAEFAVATKQVKQFKTAEKSLKLAKQSALEQASEINRLFEAIDAVSEETRQVRLTLDRQIKKRKDEIKDEHIAAGVAVIRTVIESQSADFKLIDHQQYLDEEHFVDAVKGRSSAKTMQASVDKTCQSIAAAIAQRAELVSSNATLLDNLPANQQSLFQDRASLLALESEQLNQTVDQRIEKSESLKQSKVAASDLQQEALPDEASDTVEIDSSADDTEVGAPGSAEQTASYVLTMEISATRLVAESIRDEIESVWRGDSAVKSIGLSAQ